MTPSDLANHYNADDLLAALCSKLSPEGVAAVVRAAVPFMQGEDKRTRERRLAAERSRRSYAKSHGEASESHASDSTAISSSTPLEPHGEASEPHGESDALQASAPQVPPSPPSSPTGRENLARGSVDDFRSYAVERGLPPSDGEWLHDKMLTQGWKVDGRPVKDWQALTRVWQKNGYFPSQRTSSNSQIKNGTHLRTPTSGHGRQPIDRNAGTANAGNTSDYRGVGKVT